MTTLTGIKPTGEIHIGNFFSAIKPSIERVANSSKQQNFFYFIADYHAINSGISPQDIKKYSTEIAATWLALGLDEHLSDRCLFYRQSDIPEIFELTTILMSFAKKGRINGAHSYKDKVQKNIDEGKDPDKNINMGLFTYPILMAADILVVRATQIPVGKDQIQHIEIANDMAQGFNHFYKKNTFEKIEPIVLDETGIIPGIDGRKMSKSYNNTLPIFAGSKKARKKVMSITTNSQEIEEKKNPDECNVFKIYKLFASQQECQDLAKRYRAGGMSWGEAKTILYEKFEDYISPYFEKYQSWINETKKIEEILNENAFKMRVKAKQYLKEIKEVIGIF